MNLTKTITTSNDLKETWEFSSIEWNAFEKTGTALKKEDNMYMAIGVLIVGIPFLMLKRDASFFTAVLFVIPFAILIPWLRYKLTLSYLKPKPKTVTVQFYPDFILINDEKKVLFSKNRWIKNMKIIDDTNEKKLLEIDIAWSTRKGNTFDELRIPIPPDKASKAEMLIAFYRDYSFERSRNEIPLHNEITKKTID